MADEKENTIISTEERWERIENYFNENKKVVSTIGVIILLVVVGYFGLTNWYIPTQEAEAEVAVAHAQSYFSMDSVNKAINGDRSSLGFEAIADQYSWTPTGHLANYYLGLCYYQKKDYQKAIDYLDKFNSGDVLVSANAAGVMGDAEMQLNHPDKALEDYLTAVKRNENNFTAPIYLKKAGGVCEQQANYTQAVSLYERIKTDYHASPEAMEIDKYISRAKAKGGLM